MGYSPHTLPLTPRPALGAEMEERMAYAVHMQSSSGEWKKLPSTRPLTFGEAKDEIRFARAMGVTTQMRIVEVA